MMPYATSLSSFARTSLQRLPLSMSPVDTNGLAFCITYGSQSWNATATAWLFGPDQLKNTFMMLPPCEVGTRSSREDILPRIIRIDPDLIRIIRGYFLRKRLQPAWFPVVFLFMTAQSRCHDAGTA